MHLRASSSAYHPFGTFRVNAEVHLSDLAVLQQFMLEHSSFKPQDTTDPSNLKARSSRVSNISVYF